MMTVMDLTELPAFTVEALTEVTVVLTEGRKVLGYCVWESRNYNGVCENRTHHEN